MNTYYRIRENYRIPAALDVQAAGERLVQLQREGRADSASIVEEARPVDSVLHPGIRSWNVDPLEAKERILRIEATHLRDSIEVVYILEDESEMGAPALVCLDQSAEILATEDAVYVQADRARLVQQAMRDLNGWRRRYGQLKELAKVIEAIESVAA